MGKVCIQRNLPIMKGGFSSSGKNEWLQPETFRTDFNESSDIICVYIYYVHGRTYQARGYGNVCYAHFSIYKIQLLD